MLIYIKYNLVDEDTSIKYDSFDTIINYDKVVCIKLCRKGQNELTSSQKLPNSLQQFICSVNNISKLPELPDRKSVV